MDMEEHLGTKQQTKTPKNLPASTAMTNPTEAATATKYWTSKRGRRFSNERSYVTTAQEATTTYPTVEAEAAPAVINAITHQSAT